MDHNLLVSELHALIVESRRRHPEVKDASEHALEIFKSGPVSRETLQGHIDELLGPVTLGCKTKVAKVVGISIATLQRLVSLGGVPTATLPTVLQTLASVANQAVEIQLKILQTLLSILTYNKDIHNDVLGNLQESRVSVVSSTAAATLRQAVMLIFDRTTDPHLTATATADIPLVLPSDPPIELHLTASAVDAFGVLSDLCLHTLGPSVGGIMWAAEEREKPRILKLSSLQRTFGLELIESILSGYEENVKQRPELLFLLRNSLTPLLLRLQAEKPIFPVALRVCRLIYLLVRFFAVELHDEVEAFLMLLIRFGTGDMDGEEGGKRELVPPYMRVLALEILRGICGDPALLHGLFEQYDIHSKGSKVYEKLVSSISRLVNEKPALLGVYPDIHGIGIPSDTTNASGYFDMGLGMVSAAASAGVSTVSSMMGSVGGGLGQQSSLKQRLIEQHDKAEAPPVPETYPYFLALQSLNAIAEGIYHTATQQPESARTTAAMADSAWPALLSALSLCISTNLSDQLFAELLSAFQDFTIACGMLDLPSPRDAFLSTLAKYAVPPPVVSAMQNFVDVPAARSVSGLGAESLGLTALGVGGGPTVAPTLSERNLACLKSVVTIARVLSGSLGEAWHDVLELLQNANFMINKRPATSRKPTALSPLVPAPANHSRIRSSTDSERPDAFADLDADSLQSSIAILFDGSKDLDDAAFSTFIAALCRLSSEMIGCQPTNGSTNDVSETPMSPTPKSPSFMLSPGGGENRRRASGIQISNSIKSGERSFSLSKLRMVANTNLSRLVSSDPTMGWDVITQHVLAVARHPTASSSIRLQATEALSELLLSAIRVGKQSRTQHQVFDVLVRQVDPQPVSHTLSTDYEVRAAGFLSLNKILESSGHSLEVGWQMIFNMLNSVCRAETTADVFGGHHRGPTMTKGEANLVRIAFPSLTIICTDFLSSLAPDDMRECISCLGCYGRQKEDVNIALSSIGLLWNVSDAVQGTSKRLWLRLLSELLELARNPQLEVRSSAMQTLFRCIELYASSLETGEWESVLDTVVFPLLDGMQGDESQVLAITSVGSIFAMFLPTLAGLPAFEESYRRFLETIELSSTSAPRTCCTAALKGLERVLQAAMEVGAASTGLQVIPSATWVTFVKIGTGLEDGEPYTQENLIALVRIASTLHTQLDLSSTQLHQLSDILRSAMTYSSSPEYRPDNDSMSPLQQAISDLVANSKRIPAEIALSDLAEFSSLAYGTQTSSPSRTTYVALSKYCMPKMRDVFAKHSGDPHIYASGAVQAMLGAYAIPIKLRYDCPPASKFGNDPPLWQTALDTFVPVLEALLRTLDTLEIDAERFEAVWTLTIDVFSATLSTDSSLSGSSQDADEQLLLQHLSSMRDLILPRIGSKQIPDQIRVAFAKHLRETCVLHHHDVHHTGGTRAPAVPTDQEAIRYWALDLLVACSTKTASPKGKERETDVDIARACLTELLRRFEVALREFCDDSALRGQMPFPRVREEELLYILRHLATMRVTPGILNVAADHSSILQAVYATSDRAHLFHFYTILLRLSFSRGPMPSMWLFPDEHQKIFSLDPDTSTQGQREPDVEGLADGAAELSKTQANGTVLEEREGGQSGDVLSAGDGTDLIEVTARDLSQRCLELIGQEMCLPRLDVGMGHVR